MTEKSVELLISNLPAILIAFGAMMGGLIAALVAGYVKLSAIQKATDGMHSRIVELTAVNSKAEGKAEQRAEAGSEVGNAQSIVMDRAVQAADKVLDTAATVAEKLASLPTLPVKDNAVQVRIINEDEPRKP